MSTTAPMCEPKGLLRDIMSYEGRNGSQPGSACCQREAAHALPRGRPLSAYALPDGCEMK